METAAEMRQVKEVAGVWSAKPVRTTYPPTEHRKTTQPFRLGSRSIEGTSVFLPLFGIPLTDSNGLGGDVFRILTAKQKYVKNYFTIYAKHKYEILQKEMGTVSLTPCNFNDFS